jgi:VWFA-related protein
MSERVVAFCAWVVALSSLAPAGARAQAPQRPPEFAARVDLVTVEVTVLDRDGKPVPGLAREAFSVFEDGVRQEIAAFKAIDLRPGAPGSGPAPAEPPVAGADGTAPAPPWTYVLVIDDVHLNPSQASDVRKAVSRFVEGAPDGARIVLIAVAARVVSDHTLPDGRELLLSRLKAVKGSLSADRADELMSDQEAYEIHVRHNMVIEDVVTRRIVRLEAGDSLEKADPYYDRSGMLRAVTETRGRAGKRCYLMTLRAQATLGVLRNALQWLARIGGRRTLVLASSGFFREAVAGEIEDVARASLAANVAVSFLDVRGQGRTNPYEGPEYGPSLAVESLPDTVASAFSEASGTETLALETGGLVIHRPANLAKGLDRIVTAGSTCYLLGFLPMNPGRDGKFRRLEVRLAGAQDGWKVTGRRGYYAPRE